MAQSKDQIMSSIDVRRVSTINVRPASYIDEQASDTSKRMDLLFLNDTYMQRGFLFAQQHDEENSVNDKISHLKTSLSPSLKVQNLSTPLQTYPWRTLSPRHVPQAIIDRLFLLTGVRNFQGQSHPLLSIQVTELTNGIFIGCSANHCVCDGTSFWQFINSWSEITSCSTYSCPPPVFERWFINKTDCPLRLHLSSNEVRPLDGLVERCFHFTKPNIAALKARVTLEIISETKQNMLVISSLQAILALVWTTVIRSRSCLNDNWDEIRELKIKILMNSRTKLIPPSPETYFGNSIATGIVTLKEGDLVKWPGFGFLASMLNEAVKSNNYEKSRSFTESWIEKSLISSPGGYTRIIGNRFLARSSRWFNMYGNNFGWGQPIAIRTGANGNLME
ncbi:protein ENHANCED PSEUDOMONAS SUSCEPTIBILTY 1-like [Papaver somniferum]|uniref:protein ENHANCED PSEUDOMONAS SUSCEPTIBILTY 1-like n=1 Tax=Papaver somniferum TaxID=3469 RepID=UPI000E6F7A44|nr:protein ENHANCED PSEUDOMONAS SUSCEPTIBILTY 1-like [Papaver somniferum]